MTTPTTPDRATEAAARAAVAHYNITPEHFTNPGADAWGEPGCNIGDAAWDAFTQSDHYGEAGAMGWKQHRWDAFLDAFTRHAQQQVQP